MAFRHYNGAGVDGQPAPRASGPPPAPSPRPRPRPTVESVVKEMPLAPPPVTEETTAALDALERSGYTKDYETYRVEILHIPTATKIAGFGASIAEAVQRAETELEAALPIQPLVWGDGSAIEGLAHQVLSEALETFTKVAPEDPAVQLMIGRLRGALGEEA